MTNREKREKRKTYTEKKLEKMQKKDKMAVLWQKLGAITRKKLYSLELSTFDRISPSEKKGE